VDVVLSFPLGVGVTLVAIVALVLLSRTRLFWLPGAALIGYGVAIYLVWPWQDTRHDTTMLLGGVSNLMHVAATFFVVTVGIVCLIVGARSRKRARLASTTDLPTAIVAKDSR
jgi:hypothetical protein